MPNYWLVQGNPAKYALTLRDIRTLPTVGAAHLQWTVGRRLDEIKTGDEIGMWVAAGPHPQHIVGIHAIGTVASPPIVSDPDWQDPTKSTTYVRMQLTRLARPIAKTELAKDPRFAGCEILRMPNARNPFRLSPDEWSAIAERAPSA